MNRKIVLCGAGFLGAPFVLEFLVNLFARVVTRLGSSIATAISRANNSAGVLRCVQVSSRDPHKIFRKLKETLPQDHLLPPIPVDVTKKDTLTEAFLNADAVVSLVGVLRGSSAQFEAIQWKGAENVALAAAAVGAKLVHISAIGADPRSKIPYARTKALGEEAVLSYCPNATIIRPSLIFGPGDGLFNVRISPRLGLEHVLTLLCWQRFAQLSRFLPVLPVFGDGGTRFQPVYVGDVGQLVEILTRDNSDRTGTDSKIIEAVGPESEFFSPLSNVIMTPSSSLELPTDNGTRGEVHWSIPADRSCALVRG
jgi:uncharacterized protein YbjT (DUF2867 family)